MTVKVYGTVQSLKRNPFYPAFVTIGLGYPGGGSAYIDVPTPIARGLAIGDALALDMSSVLDMPGG